jgi:hypothetical protein
MSTSINETYENLEMLHVSELERFLGKEWYKYKKLAYSEHDCQLAIRLRYEDNVAEELREYEQYEQSHEKEEKEKQGNMEVEDDYMEVEDDYMEMEDASEYDTRFLHTFMNSIRKEEEQNRLMDPLWEEWLEFNAMKPPDKVWSWEKMKKLL